MKKYVMLESRALFLLILHLTLQVNLTMISRQIFQSPDFNLRVTRWFPLILLTTWLFSMKFTTSSKFNRHP